MKHSKEQFIEKLLKLAYHRKALMYRPRKDIDDYFDKILLRDNIYLLYVETDQETEE